MVKYIIKRILMMIPMLFAALTITFFLSHAMTVNPLSSEMTQWDTQIFYDEMERLGLNDPIHIQFINYFRDFFTGNWGESYSGKFVGWSVNEILITVLPRTLELMIIPIIITPIIAVKFGTISAKNRKKKKDILIRSIAITGAGFPSFWIAVMLQYLFGRVLLEATFFDFDIGIYNSNNVLLDPPFPSLIPTQFSLIVMVMSLFLMIGGCYLIYRGIKLRKQKKTKSFSLYLAGISISIAGIIPIIIFINTYGTKFRLVDSIIFNDPIYFWDTIAHLLLPSLSMTLISLAGITRQTRSSMLEVLDQDYIRTARAKGVSEKEIINKHALRNSLIPTSNLIIGGTAAALLGSLFIELIYGYPGYGETFFYAITSGNIPLINGCVFVATIILLGSNLVADVMYTIIDPRIIYT
ncbi:MAG: ABC transporter permease [Promethearchaeota archaeon]|jgi:peptide/nickel transport system permease protein